MAESAEGQNGKICVVPGTALVSSLGFEPRLWTSFKNEAEGEGITGRRRSRILTQRHRDLAEITEAGGGEETEPDGFHAKAQRTQRFGKGPEKKYGSGYNIFIMKYM